jgi:hypothetical protein
MKRTKRIKPTASVEYRLIVQPKYKERENEYVTAVELQTALEFSNFRYEIVIQDSVENNCLLLNIRGLHAPRSIMPAVGPARFRKEYPVLSKVKRIIVTRIDGTENSFEVAISKKNVAVKKCPEKYFVEFTAQKYQTE